MKRWTWIAGEVAIVVAMVMLAALANVAADGPETAVKPRSVTKVYADGRHNMNTAFVRWQDRYWLAFRTGSKHASPDGATVVLVSSDGKKWDNVHGIDSPLDERDVQLVATPKRLFLYIPVVERAPGKGIAVVTYVTTTDDGTTWSKLAQVYETQFVLWRPFLHEGRFWATAYKPAARGKRVLDLVRSDDGLKWEKIATMRQGHSETETTLQFVAGGRLLAFHRDAGRTNGFLMSAKAPYTEWDEPRPLPVMLNGQSAYTFDGVHYLISRTIRREDKKEFVGTMIYTFDADGKLTPYCKLPASGDCAYANAIRVGDEMWVSYHSAHEGTANIYLARVPLQGK
ncbi:MAG: hypothetical protein FJ271_08010 [Planctomycetes bacterium]|nr:hypothetical protein [Planctomycetota bacterium]